MPVIIHTESFDRFAEHLSRQDLPGTRQGMSDAADIYMDSMRARFAREGDGWQELRPYTQRERARLGFAPAHPILRRLGILEAALTRGNPGSSFEQEGYDVTVGIGGGDVHPGYGEKTDNPTIAQIGRFHQSGPYARPILVEADADTLSKIKENIVAGVTLDVKGKNAG